ncbi:YbaB/EbfC family nucleoid-associated protein [Streptomyces sp. NPDC086080]|uniref:YbaB/EbfC family nucleoid-associated protein n=1 Tax=Streptomyces sp. NPDC086080 TaxID=3365748 RepID=UPI0037CEFCD6
MPEELPIDDRVKKAWDDLHAVETAVRQAEEELQRATVTAVSADGKVELTVGAQGELTAIEFPGNGHRTMTGAELSASVLDAARRARAGMARQVMETFDPLAGMLSGGPGAEGLTVDWNKIFGGALEGCDEPAESAAMSRLRDEIDED